jgi:hypothetical protein
MLDARCWMGRMAADTLVLMHDAWLKPNRYQGIRYLKKTDALSPAGARKSCGACGDGPSRALLLSS